MVRATKSAGTVEYAGGNIRSCYMKEYGGYVWQPDHPTLKWSPEPYVFLGEAKAFLRGYLWGVENESR